MHVKNKKLNSVIVGEKNKTGEARTVKLHKLSQMI
jgi:hypothetical protein